MTYNGCQRSSYFGTEEKKNIPSLALGIVRDKILSIHLADMSSSLHPKGPYSAADGLMNLMLVAASVQGSRDIRLWLLHSLIYPQKQEGRAQGARLFPLIEDMPTLMPRKCSYQSPNIYVIR